MQWGSATLRRNQTRGKRFPRPYWGLSFTHISGWTLGVDTKSLLRSGLRMALYQGTASAVPREAGS